MALPFYQRNLLPGVCARHSARPLVAVSPQVPERLVAIKRRHSLEFAVASDLGNELARRFGILYSFDEASRRAAIANKRPIGEVTGTGTWELPMPTVVVIDSARIVRFADVHPDWLVRTEADVILEAVGAVVAPSRERASQATSVDRAIVA